jgi:hypothetical protein
MSTTTVLKTGTTVDLSPPSTKTITFMVECTQVGKPYNTNGQGKCDVDLRFYMRIPAGLSLGDWTDWKGSSVQIGKGDKVEFNGKLTYTDNRWGSGYAQCPIATVRYTILSDNNGYFNQQTLSWHWGVLPYRKSDNKGFYTVGFYNESGSSTITFDIDEQAPGYIPTKISDVGYDLTYDENEFGKIHLNIKDFTSLNATNYKVTIENIKDEIPSFVTTSSSYDFGKIRLNITNAETQPSLDIKIKIVPYKDGIEYADKGIEKTISITYPMVWVNVNGSWVRGRTWIKDKFSGWKLCKDNYVNVNGTWKKAR